jgi:hypothetical protein
VSFQTKSTLLLIQACQDAPYTEGLTDAQIVSKFQKCFSSMQEDMLSSAKQSASSDLKIHLQFFSKCFDFLKGDIQNPDVLEQNIDKIIGATA